MTKTYQQAPPLPAASLPLHQQLHSFSNPPVSAHASSYVSNREQVALPKIGQTRCYWTLLSSDLHFIYLDPVLCYHLEDQQEALVGKSLLSFIHPDEQASAKHDLRDVLDSGSSHGSVTRVRFSRLSSVRRQLGYQGPPPDWAEAEKIVHDETYMAVDLVINWAADGLVLCFLHASVDINAIADNDELRKTEWTNWCGTPWLPQEQIETLYRRLLVCAPQTGSMSRVFQILLNERERPLLLSWPPDSAHGPNSRDIAKLVENVQISAGVPGGSDAKTSCTRRYKASQDMPTVFGCQVESIFIPHGTIIFACHKVNQTSPRISTTTTSATMNQVDYSTAHYVGPHGSSYYDNGTSYSLPPQMASHDAFYNNNPITQSHASAPSAYQPQRWSQCTLSSLHSVMSTDPYPAASPSHTSQLSWSSGTPSPSYTDSGPSPSFDRPTSPNYTTYSAVSASSKTAPSAVDVVPPPRRRISPTSTRDQTGPIRSSSNRPSGVLRCSSCKTTSSPEWRKGPTGKKELCNACGLRFARSRAKKEGHVPSQSRRRKDKAANATISDPVKRESNTPPSAPTYSGARRGYATSVSIAPPNNEVYSAQSTSQVVDNHTTPSPSPPASALSFVQYPGQDSRSHYTNANSYYSASGLSSLSHAHAASHPDSQQAQRHHPSHVQEPPTPHSASASHPPPLPNHQQLPPLQRLPSYVTKVSSPIPHNHSPQSSNSYERGDRAGIYTEREVHLPPTPLSAEPRNAYPSRRTLLTTQQ
ncbi:hypothetical protein CPB83DRAFT_778335 [Crepidotus variabilis]|uniref:GATA-type domain-containing protein n=1 Tax=Crepidotus variabilis TaxID=179855 RepID=A0A9P6E369_9AGAR|nr:hypothetical protein CPB83DRAFT_778335 [Crepidotus variabilis]